MALALPLRAGEGVGRDCDTADAIVDLTLPERGVALAADFFVDADLGAASWTLSLGPGEAFARGVLFFGVVDAGTFAARLRVDGTFATGCWRVGVVVVVGVDRFVGVWRGILADFAGVTTIMSSSCSSPIAMGSGDAD